MRLRRLVGLVVTFAMANLAMAGNDLVCARHSAAQAAADVVTMPDMDHSQQPGEKAPCKTPAQVDCCHAVTSCAPAMAIAAVITVVDAPLRSSAVLASIDDVPLSRIAAPEPPPPKA